MSITSVITQRLSRLQERMVSVFRFDTSLGIVVFTVVLLLILISFAVLSSITNRNSTLAAEMENMSSLGRMMSLHVQRIVFGADLLVSALEEDVEKLSSKGVEAINHYAASRQLHEKMQDMLLRSTDIEALSVANTDGRLYTSRNWSQAVASVADRQYFMALRQGQEFVISDPVTSKLTGQQVVIQARRIGSVEGNFLGVALATISTSRFSKLFADASGNDDTHVTLIRRDGEILSSTLSTVHELNKVREIWKSTEQLMARTNDAKLFGGDIAVPGPNQLLALNNVSGYPLTIVVSKAENVVLAGWRNVVWLISTFTFTAIAMVILAAYAYSRQARTQLALGEASHKLHEVNEAMKVSNRRLTETQEQALMGQWELDLLTGQLAWTNEVFRIFEIDRNKFGASYEAFLEAIHPEDREAVNTAYNTSLKNRTPYEIAHRLLFEDGRTKFVVEHCRTEYDENGKPLYSTGSVQDITALKNIENELRLARNAALEASRSKSDFLANMSHEIRTPMNAILGFTHLLMDSKPSPEQLEKLNRILTASDHLLSLINNMLDISKIEAGRMTLSPATFSPADLFSKLHTLINQRVQDKGIALSMDISCLPRYMLGDEIRLSQALLNYLANAAKFTEQGHIILRAICLDENDAGMLVRFEVEDTGIGIASDKLETIFMAFEQVDNSMTRSYGGSGLGLAITRSIAQLMNGDTGVKSTPGMGSTFWFTARLGRSAPEKIQPQQLTNNNLNTQGDYSGQRVLLVEDEPVNRILAVEILTFMPGLIVETANDGVMAVEMAGHAHYDAILMDMQMPRMNGLEATRNIRQLPGHINTPILAMTGNAFAEDKQRCTEAGMNDFIAKPFTPKQLLDGLGRWLNKSS